MVALLPKANQWEKLTGPPVGNCMNKIGNTSTDEYLWSLRKKTVSVK